MDNQPELSDHADKTRALVAGRQATSSAAAYQGYTGPSDTEEGNSTLKLDVVDLLRRYWMLLALFLILGASAGFTSVVLSSPSYRATCVLEIQGNSETLAKGSIDTMQFDASEVGIQTQINILRSGSFLRRGAERLQAETVPLAPRGRDLFSRLRQRVSPATLDPMENTRTGLLSALATFDARPVNRTKLIELTCESTSPDVAAQFVNSMAAEYIEDTSRSRMNSSQRTSEWLAAQIEETKAKLQDAEARQREFVQESGNLFAGQELSTLEDTKLVQLKSELSKVALDRIAKQTKYERLQRSTPESLPDVLNDPVAHTTLQQIDALEREKAALQITYTAKNDKVRKVDVQIDQLQKVYQAQIAAAAQRVKEEYEGAKRHEDLLTRNYTGQSQRVGSEAGKAAQFGTLKREIEMLRQVYQSLLMQANQAGLSSSVPINPIRIVEPASTPDRAYKPVPLLNISFGSMLGLALSAGIIFLRERSDRSIKSPGMTRRLLNTPELGVIPNLRLNRKGVKFPRSVRASLSNGDPLDNDYLDPEEALVGLQNAPAFIAESFRGTLTSILRHQTNGTAVKTLLVTSPGPGEGKTTVVQHLGIALAETGRRILLIDADFRCPHLHHRFGISNEWGLSDMLAEKTPLKEYPPDKLGVSTGFPGLSMIPNRPTEQNVTKSLYSPRLRAIFEALVERYDMVLVDVPPILHLADARIIAPLTDALILVLRSGVTERDSALAAHQRIQEDGLLLLGTVLTDCDSDAARKLNYYYHDYANNDAR